VYWKLPPTITFSDLELAAEIVFGGKAPPTPMSPSAALRLMIEREWVRERYSRGEALVKPVRMMNASDAFAVVPREGTADNIMYKQEYAVGITGNPPQLVFTDNCTPMMRETLRANYPRYLKTLSSIELSHWMVRVCREQLSGFSMNKSGVYFIPPEGVKLWRELKMCLEVHGVAMHEIPAVRCDQALEALVDGLKDFIATANRELYDEYEERLAAGKTTQQRVKAARAKELQERLDVIAKYEELFGVGLEAIREDTTKLNVLYAGLA